MPPLLWSNAQGADTTRPMTDATDAVDTSNDFSSFVPSLPLLWIGTGQKAEVSSPNSLYSLCGGSKTKANRKKKKAFGLGNFLLTREYKKFQFITEQMNLFLAINLPIEDSRSHQNGGMACKRKRHLTTGPPV